MAAVMISEGPVPPRSRPAGPGTPRVQRVRLVAVPDASPGVRPVARVSPATFRRRRLMALLGVVVVLVMAGQAGAALGSPSLAASGRAPSVTRYVVRPGDSLWTAAHHLAPDRDPREVVDGLVHARGNGPLMAGELLRWQP
jgi:hypothetical protein